MHIQRWADTLLLTDLSQEPELGYEFEDLMQTMVDQCQHDVIADFSGVDAIDLKTMMLLVNLHKQLRQRDRSFILCNVTAAARGVLEVTQLVDYFDIREDRSAALAKLHAQA